MLYKVLKQFSLFNVTLGRKLFLCIVGEMSATRLSPLIISCLPSGFQARRPRSAPHLTPDPEPHLRLQSSLSQELEHVWWQRQQNSICAALAQESPSNAKQTQPQEVHKEPNSSERPCQVPNHRRNKGKERARVSHFKRRSKKRGTTLSSVKMAYVWKKLREPPRTLTRFLDFRIRKQHQNMTLNVNQLYKTDFYSNLWCSTSCIRLYLINILKWIFLSN